MEVESKYLEDKNYTLTDYYFLKKKKIVKIHHNCNNFANTTMYLKHLFSKQIFIGLI